ncbi:ribosome assembly protein METTL17, mitochondrial-like [Ptychodera flava]|uniref:ribosome assembly protein METTL17, mitochondrial-like n=1 Tax=Ptychodera flava TaxID=63121 RepID=UPI00396A0D1B
MAASLFGSMASFRSPAMYCKQCHTIFLYRTKIEMYTSRCMSTIAKNKTKMDESIREFLQTSPHRKHPGLVRPKTIILPENLQKALQFVFKEYSGRELAEKSKALVNYLWSRKRPVEDSEVRRTAMAMAKQLGIQDDALEDTGELSVKESQDVKKKRKRVARELRKKMYHWKAIQYTKEMSYIYAAGRMAANYSAIYRIFHEIKKRNPDFKPKLLLDFGSGVGTTVWAANTIWENSFREIMCVDVSSDMNDFAKLLLKGGKDQGVMTFKGVFFRQYLPVSALNTFDIIVSAYTLMEMSSQKERVNAIQTLWRKTEHFLVIVENGTNEGYKIILEARDLILHGERFLKLKQKDLIKERPQEASAEIPSLEEQEQPNDVEQASLYTYQESDLPEGHVFSPCPHHLQCPRSTDGTNTPCNFEQEYESPKLLSNSPKQQKEKFSYIVFRKAKRKEDLSDSHWPRIVRPVVRKSNHIHCHICCANGQLEHAVVTASKHGKDLFYCARYARWGDRLPAYTPDDDESDSDRINDTNGGTGSDRKESKSA